MKLWEENLSRTRQRKPFTRHILRLAEKIGYKIHIHQKFSIKTVRQKLTDARTGKAAAQKEDASNRQKWLEEIAQEAQKDNLNTEWEVILKRMIEAARMKQLHLKITGIVRGGRSGLDYCLFGVN